jgi:hypothetical protein
VAGGWINSSFDLDGHRVVASVKRLHDDEAARLTAKLAWFASVVETPGADLDATEWPQLMQRILSDYVALTVDDETLERLEQLWTPLCSGAFRAFVEVNEIDPAVAKHLDMQATRIS